MPKRVAMVKRETTSMTVFGHKKKQPWETRQGKTPSCCHHHPNVEKMASRSSSEGRKKRGKMDNQ